MSRRALHAVLVGAFLLGGCTQGTPEPAPLSFAPGPVISLAVQSVEIEEQQPPVGGNFIDKRRSQDLLAAARQFLGQRIQPAGGADWGKIVIEEASIVEQPRERQGGIRGALTREPAAEMVGILAVRVAVVDGFGIERAYARARVEMRRGVLEGTKVIERDDIARNLMQDLLNALAGPLENSIVENLGVYRAT